MPEPLVDYDGFRRHILRWTWIDAMELWEVLEHTWVLGETLTAGEALGVARRTVAGLFADGLVHFYSEPGPDGRDVGREDVEISLASDQAWVVEGGLCMFPTRDGDRLAFRYEAWDEGSGSWPTTSPPDA